VEVCLCVRTHAPPCLTYSQLLLRGQCATAPHVLVHKVEHTSLITRAHPGAGVRQPHQGPQAGALFRTRAACHTRAHPTPRCRRAATTSWTTRNHMRPWRRSRPPSPWTPSTRSRGGSHPCTPGVPQPEGQAFCL